MEAQGDAFGPCGPQGQALPAVDDDSRRWADYQPGVPGDGPERFATSKLVGAYVGITPKLYQSGEVDRSGGISNAGDGMLRHLL